MKSQLSTVVDNKVVRTDVLYNGRESPLVLLCPSFHGRQISYDISEGLFEQGISSAVINYRGVSESEGEFSFPGAMHDIKMVYNGLKANFPHKGFALCGHCYGGLFSINVANDLPEIRTLVCISPLTDLTSFLKAVDVVPLVAQAKVRGLPEQWAYEQQVLRQFWNPADNFAFVQPFSPEGESSCGKIAPKTLIEHLNLDNLLVVHGCADERVRLENGVQLYDLAGCSKKMGIVPGAGHEYSGRVHRQEMVHEVVDFLRRVLK